MNSTKMTVRAAFELAANTFRESNPEAAAIFDAQIAVLEKSAQAKREKTSEKNAPFLPIVLSFIEAVGSANAAQVLAAYPELETRQRVTQILNRLEEDGELVSRLDIAQGAKSATKFYSLTPQD